jgi:type VI secretion system secreted protein VgrG
MTRRLLALPAVIATAALLLTASAFAQIPLGTAQNFAVLGGSTVTNTGPTAITGNLGVSPGSSVTGFPPGVLVGGTIHAGDAVAAQAQTDLTTAYNTAAAMPCNTDLTGQNLGGLILTPGVYCFSNSAQLTGILTLNMQGNPNALFVFKIGSTLTTASGSSVLLTNNAGVSCPANVVWQVGSSTTLGTGSSFVGQILTLASITITTGANLQGRALARNGAVTLDSNTIGLCGAFVNVPLPAIDPTGLMLLAVVLAGVGMFAVKRF